MTRIGHNRRWSYNPTVPTKKTFALAPELVPAPLWGRSAYRMLGTRAIWKKKIRPDALAAASKRCCLCGTADDRLICHDKWQYDDEKAIATLAGFEIHCGMCDTVTHLGRAMQGDNPREVFLAALAHLCAVNQCPPEAAQELLADALAVWERRNKKRWTIKVAAPLIRLYPELAALPEFVPPPPTYWK